MTIVTPSYNQSAFLEETMRSVLEQDYPQLEYIVVDGASTDGSREIIERHANRLAWWASEPDAGQAAALNKGFARATGEILGWVCSDDVLLPGAVSTAVEALTRRPELALVYGNNVYADDRSIHGKLLPARPFDVAEMTRTCQNHVVQPGSLFRRWAWELAGPLDEDVHYYFDFDFVLRLGLAAPAERLDATLATYRLHPESKSTSFALPRKADEHLRLFGTFLARDDLPPSVLAVRSEALAQSELVAGEMLYESLELRRARRLLARGLLRRPGLASRRTVGLAVKSLLPERVVRSLRNRRRGHA